MNFRRCLVPSLSKEDFGALIRSGLLGSIVAGSYGIIHDQITYTICPEYFTRFKFDRFAHTDLRLAERVRVGLIGLLAT